MIALAACSNAVSHPENGVRGDADLGIPLDGGPVTLDTGPASSPHDAEPELEAGAIEDATAPADGALADARALDAAPFDAGMPIRDLDQDGLDDDYEARIAFEYLPFRSYHANEACPRGAILYRVRPHP